MNVIYESDIIYEVSNAGYEKIYVHATGGVIWRHTLVDVNGIDYNEVLELAMDKAELGCQVHILPVLSEEDPLRQTVFAGAKKRKCPDLRINGVYTEIKTPKEKLHESKISNNIKYAHEQANNVIIRLTADFDILLLYRIVKGRFAMHKSLNQVEFKMNGTYYTYRRQDKL